MSMKNRAKATAKNIEGKVQEAVGDLTGDPKTQAEASYYCWWVLFLKLIASI